MNMQNYALEIGQVIANETRFESVGDALGYGLPTSLFGFAVVFGVLILIWGVLALFRVFFYTIPNAKKNSNSTASSNAVSAPVSDGGNVQAAVALPQTDSASVVAAIMAAISAFRAQNGEGTGAFRVVSFKKRK